MTRFALNKEDGFTIQETLVTLVVGSLLISLCLSLFLSTSKLVARWQVTTEDRADLSRSLQVFYRDAQQSGRLVASDDTVFVLQRNIGRQVAYRLNGDGLWRDDVSILVHKTVEFRWEPPDRGWEGLLVLQVELEPSAMSVSSPISWSSRESFARAMKGGGLNAVSR